ncbi:MAG: hypothetical protein MHM6MM_006337 [Cercozoa sp. M6MM]
MLLLLCALLAVSTSVALRERINAMTTPTEVTQFALEEVPSSHDLFQQLIALARETIDDGDIAFRKMQATEQWLFFGDVHGDHGVVEAALDRFGLPEENRLGYVFQGDVLDRADSPKEEIGTFALVLLLKLKSPKNVVFIRGNHETGYGISKLFYAALQEVFPDQSTELMRETSRLFLKLPFALLVQEHATDKTVLFVHGGLPMRGAKVAKTQFKQMSRYPVPKYLSSRILKQLGHPIEEEEAGQTAFHSVNVVFGKEPTANWLDLDTFSASTQSDSDYDNFTVIDGAGAHLETEETKVEVTQAQETEEKAEVELDDLPAELEFEATQPLPVPVETEKPTEQSKADIEQTQATHTVEEEAEEEEEEPIRVKWSDLTSEHLTDFIYNDALFELGLNDADDTVPASTPDTDAVFDMVFETETFVGVRGKDGNLLRPSKEPVPTQHVFLEALRQVKRTQASFTFTQQDGREDQSPVIGSNKDRYGSGYNLSALEVQQLEHETLWNDAPMETMPFPEAVQLSTN